MPLPGIPGTILDRFCRVRHPQQIGRQGRQPGIGWSDPPRSPAASASGFPAEPGTLADPRVSPSVDLRWVEFVLGLTDPSTCFRFPVTRSSGRSASCQPPVQPRNSLATVAWFGSQGKSPLSNVKVLWPTWSSSQARSAVAQPQPPCCQLVLALPQGRLTEARFKNVLDGSLAEVPHG